MLFPVSIIVSPEPGRRSEHTLGFNEYKGNEDLPPTSYLGFLQNRGSSNIISVMRGDIWWKEAPGTGVQRPEF